MDSLYGETCDRCGGFTNSAEHKVTFSAEALTKGLEAIFGGFNVRDGIQKDIFRETLRLFNLAAARGISESGDEAVITDEFLEQIRHNNEVFSAFRTHRMQNDIAAQLVDAKGQLKSYEQFRRDVAPLTGKYCDRWLNTEYNTAVIRAHRAADWKHFENEKDVYPNLRWMPTTSVTPDPVHFKFWSEKLTLPVDDPFWGKHHPGERWGCKCTCEQTDEPVNDLGVREDIKDTASRGLHGNPAETGKLFSDDHPYIAETYPGAEEAVENLDYVVNGRTQIKALDGKSYELTKKIVDTEEEIRMNKDFETAVAFDKSGKIVVDKRGKATSVDFTKEDVGKLKNTVITHNHPRGWGYKEDSLRRIGNSFSKADIMTAVSCDVAEIRAVTPNYTFSLRRPEKGWGITPKQLQKKYTTVNKQVFNKLQTEINAGHISIEQAQTIHYHHVARELAKKCGWTYEKKRTK